MKTCPLQNKSVVWGEDWRTKFLVVEQENGMIRSQWEQ